jgi:subtilisin family serine protease
MTALLLTTGAMAAEMPLKIAAKDPKIPDRFLEKMRESTPEQEFKIWVFLTDKGIFDQKAYKASLEQVELRFTERAISRRERRTEKGEFDFHDIPVNTDYISRLAEAGLRVAGQSRWLNAVSGYASKAVIEKIAESPFVAEVRPVANSIRRRGSEDSVEKSIGEDDSADTLYGESYLQLDQVKIVKMHQRGYSGKGVLMALFDTGFKLDHPTFDSANIIDKYDFINNDFTVDDTILFDTIIQPTQPAHGTSTLSICAGFSPNELIGGAYGADFIVAMTEKVGSEDTTEEDNWIRAAEWADSLGADIISSSLGYMDWYDYDDLDGNTAAITIAADLAVSRGIAVFNSAGNERNGTFYYINPPADGDSVIAVGAVTNMNVITSFSSAGPTRDGRIKPDLVALGSGVRVASFRGGFAFGSGTSYSAPLAASAAALLLEAHPDWTPMDVRQAMIASADKYEEPNNLYGYGLFNTFKAAGLFAITPVDPIVLAEGDSLNITFSIPDYEDSAVEFSATNLPPSAVFTESGELRYMAVADDIGDWEIRITAVFGIDAAAVDFRLIVVGESGISCGPNPFSDSTTIFVSSKAGNLKNISIYSIAGEKVWEKSADNNVKPGDVIAWRGKNSQGQRVAPGVYLVFVKTDRLTQKFKLLLM